MFSGLTRGIERQLKVKDKRKSKRKSDSSIDHSERISINISGTTYETRVKTLSRFPETLLGDENRRSLYYCTTTNQYYFRRSRLFFDSILFFYQSNGILRCPHDIPVDLFEEECRFFQMPEDAIVSLRYEETLGVSFDQKYDHFNIGDKSTPKSKLWNLLTNPQASREARYFASFSMFMISLSVASVCLESLPSSKAMIKKWKMNPWRVLDLILNTWFLLELTGILICTPNRKHYLKSLIAWVDIIAIVPYFFGLIASNNTIASFAYVRSVRMFRVFRLLRLSKYSRMIRIVAYVIKSSQEEFKTLSFCLIIVVVFGGSVMYFIESDVTGTHFTNIVEGIYWGMQTVTTVGYGDMYPTTTRGKIFASAFMCFGVISIAIPVISIIAKFAPLHKPDIILRGEENKMLVKWWMFDFGGRLPGGRVWRSEAVSLPTTPVSRKRGHTLSDSCP